jgi:hypothetical protein
MGKAKAASRDIKNVLAHADCGESRDGGTRAASPPEVIAELKACLEFLEAINTTDSWAMMERRDRIFSLTGILREKGNSCDVNCFSHDHYRTKPRDGGTNR